MIEPLNKSLYEALERAFGHVIVSNEGSPMQGRYILDTYTKRIKLSIGDSGEYYRVNCDKCNDTRFRLYINHRWGVKDKHGHRNLFLAICYNENCYKQYSDVADLLDRLDAKSWRSLSALPSSNDSDIELGVASPPGPIKLLTELPSNHQANWYLASRFFVPERLAHSYGIGVCVNSIYYLARNRIYIPLCQDGLLRGWQCRFPDDMDWKSDAAPPKYFSMPNMKRRALLFNLDVARTFRTGVVTEGPLSSIGFGAMAVASIGFPVTSPQRRLLMSHFKDHSLVLLVNPDVFENPAMKAQLDKAVKALDGKFKDGLATVKLPDGADPAQYDRRFMRRYVEREAKAQGVKISWNQR